VPNEFFIETGVPAIPIGSLSAPVTGKMKKDLSTLKDNQFDLVIVGAGIHGSILALEAVRAGYSVALLEKGDFGHSTSANSLKIIHGGIRYLQHADFKRMRESIVSRRSMMTFAPHLVKPLACLMPTYGHGIKGREMMRLAFSIYDLVAFDRNKGLMNADSRLPCGTGISRDEVQQLVPGIKEKGLTGGAVWYDAMADNTERLVLEYVKEAVKYGAVAANYARVTEVETAEKQVSAVIVSDVKTGEAIRVRCRSVVNAAGPWLENLAGGQSEVSGQRWATAVNIVVKKRLFRDIAVGLEGFTDYIDKDAIIKRGKRLFFFVPWQDKYTMIGTAYKPYHGVVDDFSLPRDEVQQLLNDINKIYPAAELTMEDVSFFHGGLLPMNEADENNSFDSVQLDKSSRIIDHGPEGGMGGFFSIKGVKYTTAPDIARRIIRILQNSTQLGKSEPGCYKISPPDRPDYGLLWERLGKHYEEIRAHLRSRYSSGGWREVLPFLAPSGEVELSTSLWVSEDPPLLVAELLFFIHEEMASTLADVVFRRSNLGTAECPEMRTLSRLAQIMGHELGWTAEEREQQIGSIIEVFAPLKN
jgi:glycerol-3-phosphate dehydrogenase